MQNIFDRTEKNTTREDMVEWTDKIPSLIFPDDWGIKIIPPFGGAVIRFLVNKEAVKVSVYLDCYDALGCYGEPYWEIYPYDEDVYRVPMQYTVELFKRIKISLEKQLKESA